MSETQWKYLERRPGSGYQQLCIKGKRIWTGPRTVAGVGTPTPAYRRGMNPQLPILNASPHRYVPTRMV